MGTLVEVKGEAPEGESAEAGDEGSFAHKDDIGDGDQEVILPGKRGREMNQLNLEIG